MNELQKMYEKVKLFLDNGYNFEDLEYQYHQYMEDESMPLEKATVSDIYEALDEEQSCWD